MTAPGALLDVTGVRLAQPDGWRFEATVPHGLTIVEIVRIVLPGSDETTLARVRVSLVRGDRVELIHPQVWRLARPRPGTRIVVALAPGKELKSILSVLVSIAAAAIGQFWLGPLLGSTFGYGVFSATQWASIASLGLTALGGLLINALLPTDRDAAKEKPTHAISGWKNELRPDGPVPNLFGKLRYAPPFAAYSWTEVVGDVLFTRAAFNLGYGPVKVSDLKLGANALTDYDEFQVNIREGRPGDAPLTLYTGQVIEQSQGVDLVRPLPRDDAGNVTAGDAIPKPVTRVTASDASGCCIILSFPAGLYFIQKKGKEFANTITIRRKFRLLGTDDWTTLDDVKITAFKQVGFFRAIRWDFPVRGRYEICLENLTPEYVGDGSIGDKCTWALLQSFRPEYPLNFGKPLALVEMRVKATYQIQGQLDNFNCVVSREAKDWNGTAWVAAETRNPAALAIWSLQGPGNAFPVADDDIDWPAFQDWHEFCVDKGLSYNRVHDFDGTLADELKAIGAAGCAAIRRNGVKWTVIVDRPRTKVIEHINARNASQIKFSSKYGELPDAWRISFQDETNNFEPAERLVPRPGLVGPIRLTEQVDFPGVTDPDQIWLAGIRRWYEIMHRATMWSAVQQGSARVATMGDQVMLSRDIVSTTVASARVKAVRGAQVELDDAVHMDAGASYAIRFRVISEADTIGDSIVRTVRARSTAGDFFALTLTGAGPVPQAGDLVHFGPAAEDSIALIVAGIERGQNNATILNMLPAAPEIDALTDATPILPWDGRIGAVVDTGNYVPAPPVIVGVASGASGTGDPDGLAVYLVPGAGPATIAAYAVRHRLVGAGAWEDPVSADAAGGHVDITGYANGDNVEFQPRAISTQGLESDWGATVDAIIGENDAPAASGFLAAAVTAGLGAFVVDLTPAAGVTEARIYAQPGTGGTLDRDADLIQALTVVASQAARYVHGDPTILNLLANGSFSADANWAKGTGWTIAAGKATHAAGTASNLTQSGLAALTASVYRTAGVVSGRTAGTVQPFVTAATQLFTAVSANGPFQQSKAIAAGPTSFGFSAGATFDGSVDDAVLFKETAACIAQGDWTVWIEPFNDDDAPGPLSGPFVVTVP